MTTTTTTTTVPAPTSRTRRPVRPADRIVGVARTILLGGLSLVLLVPLYLLLLNTFKTEADIERDPLGLPFGRLTLENLRAAVTDPTLGIWSAYARTIVITLSTVTLSIIVAASAGYVLARATSRWSTTTYLVVVGGLLIPTQVVLLPAIHVLRTLGIFETWYGLVLYESALSLPFAVFIFTGFVRTVPRELDEAAAIDGCGQFGTFWRIVFPTLRPATAAVAIFLGLGAWNDFVDPIVILGQGGDTITTGIFRAVGQFRIIYAQAFANLWLAVVPVLVVYVFLQKQFISGLTDGAVKG